ncbi:Serine/threonine-protein phosphatase 6 regulatory subunit 1 [Galdieria sulphuraria]|nr:Serine/threonine-protein phosphatase 6 regulatory subunit 1 [Galdieria sulphuraria]
MFFRAGLGSPAPIDLFLDRVEREKLLEKVEEPLTTANDENEQEGELNTSNPEERLVTEGSQTLAVEEAEKKPESREDVNYSEKEPLYRAIKLLAELLDEDDLLVELRASNKRLLNFFSNPLIIKALISYVTDTVPRFDEDQMDLAKLKFKFPLVACEILCSENLRLRDPFANHSDSLKLLFSFLRKPTGEIDMSTTGNFARVVLTLIRLYPDVIKNFVQENLWILDCLIQHLYCMSLADILLRLYLHVGYDIPKSSLSWSLSESQSLQTFPGYLIFDKLGESFSPSSFPELDDFNRNEAISNSASVMKSILLRGLSLLGDFDNIWSCPALMNALRVCCELLISLNSLKGESSMSEKSYRRHSTTFASLESSEISVTDANNKNPLAIVESELVSKLPKLGSFLAKVGTENLGLVDSRKVLGTLRLKIAEFFLTCLVTCSQDTVVEIFRLGIPKLLLRLFVVCDMCNILHNYIVSVISSCFCGDFKVVQKLWIQECHIYEWLVEAWSENDKIDDLRFRKGYMGHLTQIGNILSQYLDEQYELVVEYICKEELELFEHLRNTYLSQTNEIQSKPLGGSHPGQLLSSAQMPVPTSSLNFPEYDQFMAEITSSDAEAVKKFAEYLYEQTNGEIDNEDDEDEELMESSRAVPVTEEANDPETDDIFKQAVVPSSESLLVTEETTEDYELDFESDDTDEVDFDDLAFTGDAIFASARDFPSERDLEQLRSAIAEQKLTAEEAYDAYEEDHLSSVEDERVYEK